MRAQPQKAGERVRGPGDAEAEAEAERRELGIPLSEEDLAWFHALSTETGLYAD